MQPQLEPLLSFDEPPLPPPPGCRPASPVPLNHYLQNMISPRSRAEYDQFNRFHFGQQRRDRRAITPKARAMGRESVCVRACVCRGQGGGRACVRGRRGVL